MFRAPPGKACRRSRCRRHRSSRCGGLRRRSGHRRYLRPVEFDCRRHGDVEWSVPLPLPFSRSPERAPPTTSTAGITLDGAYTVTNTGDGAVYECRVTAEPATSAFSAVVVGVGAWVVIPPPARPAILCDLDVETASATAASLGKIVATGSTVTLCVSVGLPLTAANGMQGSTAQEFSMTVGGTQVMTAHDRARR